MSSFRNRVIADELVKSSIYCEFGREINLRKSRKYG
jgi:hypothetical protein